MIKLVFTLNRDTITIEIDSKIIFYRDKKFPKGFQFMPKDPNLKRMVIFSRNKIPMEVIKWVESSNTGKNLEQYNSAKDDEELVPIIVNDARINGLVFQGRGK